MRGRSHQMRGDVPPVRIEVGFAPLSYYDDIIQNPQNSIIGGASTPFPIPPPPSPDDPVDAARLGRRLQALAAALDDLPAQARRFARWRAARDAIVAQNRNRDAISAQDKNRDAVAQTGGSRHLPYRRAKPRRIWPLRPGRPPGWRRKPEHEVHEILNDLHGLAFDVLERRDTS